MRRPSPVVIVGLVLAALVLAADGIVLSRNLRVIGEVSRSVLYSRDILVELDRIRGSVEQADLHRRFFKYTSGSEKVFRQGFEAAGTKAGIALDKLAILVKDDPRRAARYTEMRRVVDIRMAAYLASVEAAQRGEPEPAGSPRTAEEIIAPIVEFDDQIAVMRDAEARFLDSRINDARSAGNRVLFCFGLAASLAMALPLAIMLMARRGLAAKNEALRRREAWLDVTLQSVGDALIATDAQGRVVLSNPAAQALTGWKPEEALGRPLADIFRILDETTRRRLESPVVDVFRRGDISALDNHTLLIARDGTETPIEETAAPIRGDRGELEGAVLVFRDVADRKRQEIERDRLLAEAESANRAKDRFLAVLSHELRTPLNPVLLATTALLDGTLPAEETGPTLAMIRRNIELEARLIDDLLDITRIVQGKLVLRDEPTDAHIAIREAVETCRGDIEAAGIQLTLDLSARRRIVQGDPARLQQVAWNLIKNAVKFTPRGGTIAVRSHDQAGLLVIEVEDTGIGMEAETLGRIFEPFHQGDQPAARRAGGLGLGLAISRSVVLAHGGRVTAQSPGRGGGSTFRVELPVAPLAIDRRGGDAASQAVMPGASLRILLVEDDVTTLGLMARLLGRLGHDVSSAATLAAALQAFEEGEFDLVISDLGLPDGSGLDLLRQIGPFRAVPAIALTGHGMEDAVRSSIEAGFSVHLTKPIDLHRLKSAIAKVTAPSPD